MTIQATKDAAPEAGFSLYDPKLRGYAYQAILLTVLIALVVAASVYAKSNMERLGIPLNFKFWDQTAGFEINQTLISYSALSSYGQAFWVGLLNTLLVGVIGVVFATAIGFVVAVLRLSPNWIVSRLATVYVELFRNIPLLLQLLFWYTVVLKSLPQPRQSISLFGAVFLNTRGLVLPSPVFRDNAGLVGWALVLGIVLAVAFSVYAARRQAATGQQLPRLWVGLALVIGLPLIAYLALGLPIGLDLPQLKGFNFIGGKQVFPELAALLLGLSIYTGAFISEIVRAGIMAVGRGQHEAAGALGIRPNVTMRLVVIPQAMRVIVPPLTNQYLNLVKNSSLAVFIGYPDLVQVFAGTVLNQTGAAIQCMAVTMAVYLAISLLLSGAMNAYNKRVALVEKVTAVTDATYSGQAYLRTAPSPTEPPPALVQGPLAWGRKNLFSSPMSAVLTVASVLFLLWVIPGLVRFLVVDAVWHGDSGEVCRANQGGACWPFIWTKSGFFWYGAYPESEHWRVNLVEAIGAVLLAWLLWQGAPKRNIGAFLFFIVYPVVAFFLLSGATWLGLPVVETSLWGGVLITLLVSLVGIVFALPLGVMLALGRRSKMPIVNAVCTGFIEIVRGVPFITVLFMANFMLPLFLPEGWTPDRLLRPLVGTALFAAAYMAEVVRGGLQAMPKGQFEGAASLGLGYWKTMRLIILPQALTLVIPGIVSNFISLFKDTTLVSIVGIYDLLRTIESARNDPNWASPTTSATGYVVAAAFFWIFCFGMSRYSQGIERRLRAGRRH